MLGRGGDDRFFAKDGEPDSLAGVPGNDTAVQFDQDLDSLSEIESP
jgi:hypothetical protein